MRYQNAITSSKIKDGGQMGSFSAIMSSVVQIELSFPRNFVFQELDFVLLVFGICIT